MVRSYIAKETSDLHRIPAVNFHADERQLLGYLTRPCGAKANDLTDIKPTPSQLVARQHERAQKSGRYDDQCLSSQRRLYRLQIRGSCGTDNGLESKSPQAEDESRTSKDRFTRSVMCLAACTVRGWGVNPGRGKM